MNFRLLKLFAFVSIASLVMFSQPAFAEEDGGFHAFTGISGSISPRYDYKSTTADDVTTTTYSPYAYGWIVWDGNVGDIGTYYIEIDADNWSQIGLDLEQTLDNGNFAKGHFENENFLQGTYGETSVPDGGDTWVQAGTSSMSVKMGNFEVPDSYPSEYDVLRISHATTGTAATYEGDSNTGWNDTVTPGEGGLALGFNMDAAEIQVYVSMKSLTDEDSDNASITYDVNQTLLRPHVKFSAGDLSVKASFESITKSTQDGEGDYSTSATGLSADINFSLGNGNVGLAFANKTGTGTDAGGNAMAEDSTTNFFLYLKAFEVAKDKKLYAGFQSVSNTVTPDGGDAATASESLFGVTLTSDTFFDADVIWRVGLTSATGKPDEDADSQSQMRLHTRWYYSF